MDNWRNESNHQLLEKGLQRSFIPAGTPSYGGLWERVIGLFKRHLASATRGDVLHVDTFNTIIIEIEGILNRRPIMPGCMKFKRVILSEGKYSHGKISHGEKSEQILKRWYLSHGDLSDLYLLLSYQIKVWEQQPRSTYSTERCMQRFKTDPVERPRSLLFR